MLTRARGALYAWQQLLGGGARRLREERVLHCQARYEAWQPYPSTGLSSRPVGGSPFPYASCFWTLVMTRSPAATPAWTVSSMRPARSRPAWSRRCCDARPHARRRCVSRSKRRSPRRIRRSARVRALRVSVWPRRSRRRSVTPRRRRQRLDDVGGDGVDAVTRLQDGADVDEAGALSDVAALLGRRLGGGRVGLGGVARLVLRGGARATTGGLRRRLGGRRTRRCRAWSSVVRLRVAVPSWRRRCASRSGFWWWCCQWWWPCGCQPLSRCFR